MPDPRPALNPEQIRQLLSDNGLMLEHIFNALGTTFGDCANHFGDPDHPAAIAAREYHSDGDLEFDNPGIVVSEGDDPDGDYVMCWKWVEYDKEKPDADG